MCLGDPEKRAAYRFDTPIQQTWQWVKKLFGKLFPKKTTGLAKLSRKNTSPPMEEYAWTHNPFQKEPPYGTYVEKEWNSSNLNSTRS